MAQVQVTTRIAAPIDVVWNVLTEGERYGAWASGWTEVRGEFEDGARVSLVGDGGATKVKVAFGVGDGPGRSMRWSSGLPGLGHRRDFALTEPDRGEPLTDLGICDTAGNADASAVQAFADAVRIEAERRA